MLARHRILHELGRGATGAVYAARDSTTGAVVALKRLDPALSEKSGANLAGRFLKHARSARRLRHRNIVTIHDAGEAAGTAYVAMEMLEGESLRKILDDGPLPVARAIRIAHEIASGLAYAHLEGVVHGGLKPSNIIILRSGVVKITDFGTAQPGASPEQMRGDPIDHRCDVFALGALLYEMLTRKQPRGEPPPPPSELNPLVPRALDAVVLSMLAGQPAARMPGVPVLLRELERLEEGLGLGSGAGVPDTGEPTPSAPPAEPEPGLREEFAHHRAMMERQSRPERSSRSRPAIFAVLALALVVAGIGLTGFEEITGFIDDWSGRGEPAIAASPVQPAPLPSPAPAPMPAEPLAAADPPPEEQAPEEPAQPASVASTPAGTARLIVAVSPRGEIYVDGKHHGTTPPVTTFDLEPGMRRIEVRNGSRKPYLTYMTVEAGDVRRIRHDFNAKPSRLSR